MHLSGHIGSVVNLGGLTGLRKTICKSRPGQIKTIHVLENITHSMRYIHTVATVQLNLKFTHACRHTRVLARLTRVKLQKLVCACTVARSFGVRTRTSEHTKHMTNARHELALGSPHYMCGVTTGTVTVGNEMQLFCN